MRFTTVFKNEFERLKDTPILYQKLGTASHVLGLGAPEYCTSTCPCGANEGHCQSHDQCVSGTFCLPESCPISLGFSNATSCCQDVSCGFADVEVGFLLSPNYPNNYQNNKYCTHQLSAEPGKMITVEFESFAVSCFLLWKKSSFN